MGTALDPLAARAPKLPSERRFGLVFSLACLAAAGYCWIRAPQATLPLAAIGAALGLTGLLRPALLTPLNRAWFRLGLLLGRIVSPLVLGLIFYGLLTPIAWTSRVLGRDALRLKKQSNASYWIERRPPGPTPQSFKHPF